MRDPRWAQILVLSGLMAWGSLALEFGFTWQRAVVTVGAALLTQAFGNAWRNQGFEARSALISSLSLILLLRTSDIVLCVLAAAIAVGSKFVVRFRGRHVFNPTNIALVALLLVTDAAWVSSGQWGSEELAVATILAAAFWVLPRVHGDVTIAFLVTWFALLFGRSFWLGDPLAIPLHQVSSGTLFVFAAFMLSDPRTIPNARAGRIVFAGVVALCGYIGRFVFYEPNALLYSLAGSALLVPWIDHLFPGELFQWSGMDRSSNASDTPKENSNGLFQPTAAR